jgi:hypothetical protein
VSGNDLLEEIEAKKETGSEGIFWVVWGKT